MSLIEDVAAGPDVPALCPGLAAACGFSELCMSTMPMKPCSSPAARLVGQ